MRDFAHRDGSITVRADDDDDDEIYAEAVIRAFTPILGNAHCICGAPLAPWTALSAGAGLAELVCHRCHRVHGTFELAVVVRR